MTGQGGPKTPCSLLGQEMVARRLLQLNAEAVGRNAFLLSDTA